MLDYKSIIRLKKMGLKTAAIANNLGCKWESVERIVTRCESVWGSVDGVPGNLTNEEIADFLFTTRKSVDLDYLQPDSEKILEKQRQGFQRNELWAEYCAEAASKGKKAYKLSRFNEIVSDYRSKNDISFTMNHVPGLEGQADWTGDHGHFIDLDTGEIIEVHVFVMTLPYSGYFYCEGFLNEKMPSWYAGHANAFEFFGGAPAFVIPDNCATAVDRQHFDEKGILNTRYVEFLNHYGVIPKPTRIKKPRDKGHVERHVRIVEDDIIRPMERLDIYSLQEYNDIMRRKLIARNAKDYSKKLGSRTSIFEAEEKETLLPLPVLQYRSYEEKTATVWRDFHIHKNKLTKKLDGLFPSNFIFYFKSNINDRKEEDETYQIKIEAPIYPRSLKEKAIIVFECVNVKTVILMKYLLVIEEKLRLVDSVKQENLWEKKKFNRF